MSRAYIDRHTRAFKCGHPKCTQSFGCASDCTEHEITIHLMHSGPHIDSHPPPISKPPYFQDEPNSSGFEGWYTTAPVPGKVAFDTEQIGFEDSKQLCPVAPLQYPIRWDPNSQLATNDFVRPYEYTSSNNPISAGMSATIMRLLRWPVLITHELVDLHDCTTLSKSVQLPTPDTSYDENQVLSGRKEDSQTSSTINSLGIQGIYLNLKWSTLEPKGSENVQECSIEPPETAASLVRLSHSWHTQCYPLIYA